MTTMEASPSDAAAIVVPSRFGRRAAIQAAIAVVIFWWRCSCCPH